MEISEYIFIKLVHLFIIVILMDQLAFVHNQELPPEPPTYQTGFPSDFSITPIVTEDYLIRLNISWKEKIDGILQFEISAFYPECLYNADLIDISTTNNYFIFPTLDTLPRNTLNPNCTYDLTLKSQTNSSQNIKKIFIIPSSVGKYKTCSNHDVDIKILDISPKNNKDEFIVKWFKNSSYDMEDIFFDVMSKDLDKYNYSLMNVTKIATHEKESFAVIKMKNITLDQEYILYTTFHFNYTSGEYNDMNCEITVSNEFIEFEISAFSPECLYNADLINISTTNNSFIFPKLDTLSRNTLNPNCTYDLTLKSQTNSSQNIKKIFIIPSSVGKYKTCSNHDVDIEILDISPKNNKDEFIVKWFKNSSYDMKDIFFNVMSKDLGKYNYSLINVTKIATHEKESFAVIKMKNITLDQEYILYTTFHFNYTSGKYNDMNCEITVSKEFMVPGEKHYILIISTVIILIIIIGFIYKLTSRYCVKIIHISKLNRNEVEGQPILNNIASALPHMEKNILYIGSETLEDKFEFPRNRVTIIKKIDDGAFGDVYTGEITKNDKIYKVAIKTLRETCKEVDEFLAEIEIFKKIQERSEHENIVRLLGCCTQEQPYLMIMEYVPCGNLKNYLIKLRKQWINSNRIFFPDDIDGFQIIPTSPTSPVSPTSSHFPTPPQAASTVEENEPCTPLLSAKLEMLLDNKELQEFALQIAKGMAYLESIPITHRDLAARNILITKDKVLKISDFGLSRTGSYINCSLRKKVPFRWMALEAILEQKYNNKSDVWSFGIVLWEIGTLGALPYTDILDPFLLIEYLKKGERLSRPEICTDELFALMMKCWDKNPDERPSFKELVELLDENKTTAYIEFSQLNPLYVFPPSESNTHLKANKKNHIET